MSKSTMPLARQFSSREAVESAIEKSKDGRDANWDRPASPKPTIPKWEKADRPAPRENHGP